MPKSDKNKISKRIIACTMAVSISLTFVACGGNYNGEIGGPADPSTKNITDNKIQAEYCFADTVYDTENYDKEQVDKNITEVALRLFKEELKNIERSSDNVLISPTSIISALGMTTYGMEGNTIKQLEEAFGIGRGHLNYYNSEYLSNTSDDLKIANSIWFTNADHFKVNDAFLYFNDDFYGADIYETAFDENTLNSINRWVEEKTDGTIKKMLDQIPEEAVMYLINALVFEAEWEEQYKEHQIWEDSIFTTSDGEKQKISMMASSEDWYLEDDYAKGFIKYYEGRRYAFVAMLPNEDISVADYVKTLSGVHLYEMLENPKEAIVEAWIPQFSYEYETEMSTALQNMGITDAFDIEKANFSNMATSTEGNLAISRVLHKTFIDLTPVGTKAGAATIIELECGCAMGPEELEYKTVHLDRPFLYMIIDCDSNTPVFIGTVNTVE